MKVYSDCEILFPFISSLVQGVANASCWQQAGGGAFSPSKPGPCCGVAMTGSDISRLPSPPPLPCSLHPFPFFPRVA